MSADVMRIRQIPSRVAFGCTDASAAFPHGGTSVGVVIDIMPLFASGFYTVRAVEWGMAAAAVVRDRDAVRVEATLRDWNNDAAGHFFGQTTAGAVRTGVGYDTTAAGGPGSVVSPSVVIVSPLSPEVHEALVLYAALPTPDTMRRLAMRYGKEAHVPVVWEAAPDTSGRVWDFARLEDITL